MDTYSSLSSNVPHLQGRLPNVISFEYCSAWKGTRYNCLHKGEYFPDILVNAPLLYIHGTSNRIDLYNWWCYICWILYSLFCGKINNACEYQAHLPLTFQDEIYLIS